MADDGSSRETGKWAAIIVGLVMAVPVAGILATQAPAALLALIVVGFLAWVGVRSGVLAREREADAGADPLATLQERYAEGELTEAEFERRLDQLLESDRRAEGADRLEATAVEHESTGERE